MISLRSFVSDELQKLARCRIITTELVPRVAAGLRRKRVSAMMRVKNEGAFLRVSVESILELVDEVVIVDNASTDSTPEVAGELVKANAGKVRLCHYPHTIARVGSENHSLAKTSAGRRSPNLLANYYNWCLEQCRNNFVLKWDGDMVATAAFARHIQSFRDSKHVILCTYGANLHPDGHHLIDAPAAKQLEIQERMEAPMTVENWTAPYTSQEPRLFPRWLSTYKNEFWWCESLHTPFFQWPSLTFRSDECGYLHLKYCKPQPYENFSDSFATLIASGIQPGPDVPNELRVLAASISKGASL